VRWSNEALATGVAATADDRSGYVAITLAWHQLVVTHVIDEGDRAPR
jgi:hypothetical protein